ncbi:MAG: rubredoxin-like domain-containing protein [Limnochordia bacterium]|mgnify:FL=1
MHWKCSVCNYIWEGEAPPEKCPKCSHPKEKYQALTEEQWGLVERSRLTNDLHVKLLNILPALAEIARQGIEDDLDPPCVKIFQKIREQASFLEQSIKAELEGHMKKGKWG